MEDLVVKTLQEKYFKLAASEDYPNTPAITKELDELQNAIKKLNNRASVKT
jgi:hypothetical protein